MTRFSIIIPFHNDAGTIQETLDSIRAQSFTNWEAYCIGDRPSRASCIEVLEHAERDPRIHVALSPVKGPAG
ncbi:MAG: glycosyltransferase, partial [Mangrovicoccus sp.]|nr:glycosyltransferase [Mangrovicoccus sp.]